MIAKLPFRYGTHGQSYGNPLAESWFPSCSLEPHGQCLRSLLALGATPLSLDQIANYPVILTCLADDAAVQSVFEQIQPDLVAGQVIVDFSSLSVHQTKTLAEQAQAKQAIWIDSPVSGGTAGAEQGTLVIFAGGDAEIITALDPIYKVLSQRVTRMGDTGTVSN